MAEAGLERLLERVRAQMELDSETEHEVLAELRAHLEEALAEERASGHDEDDALARVAARFGVEETGQALQAAHVGWGTADAVVFTALPVLCALVLRWLAFAPDGTALGWPALLNRPSFWVVALVALLVPWLKLQRWRYALVSWSFFWALSVACVTLPALRW